MLNEKTNEIMQLPCGRCAHCRARRASAWSFRLRKEVQRAKNAYFVTLTYDNEHVPISKNRFMTLDKSHVQLFIKTIRNNENRIAKRLGRKSPVFGKLTYFGVGEYGSEGSRPHYHLLIFNCHRQGITDAWSHTTGSDRTAPRIARGAVWFGNDTSPAAIGYCLKYISKAGKIPEHARDDREKEFALMSKGIGSNYLTDDMVKWHKNDLFDRYYVPIEDGKRIAMPRYYKNKIYTPSEMSFVVKQTASLHPPLQLTEEQRIRVVESKNREYFKRNNQKTGKL